jgi:hypothetical protein
MRSSLPTPTSAQTAQTVRYFLVEIHRILENHIFYDAFGMHPTRWEQRVREKSANLGHFLANLDLTVKHVLLQKLVDFSPVLSAQNNAKRSNDGLSQRVHDFLGRFWLEVNSTVLS